MLASAGAVGYGVFALLEHRNLRTATYDLVIFDQAVRGYSDFAAPVSAAKGVHNGFGPDFSVIGDHFSPVLALFAPLYWVHDDPVTLLVAQAVLFAASVIPVFAFTRRALGETAAWLVSSAYLLSWGLQEALAVDVHEVAFAVPLVAVALERLQAQRLGQASAAVVALLLVKEDMGLLVAAFGVLVVLLHRRWRLGLALIVAGAVAVLVSILVVIPAAGGRSGYYWTYDAVGADLDVLRVLVTPDTKWQTLLWLVVPLGLLPLLSPLSLLAVPFLLERFLSANPNHWTTEHHYNAVLMPILLLAAVDGISRSLPRVQARLRGPVAVAWSAAVLAGALLLCAVFPFQRLAERAQWQRTETAQQQLFALGVVPDGATVEASNQLGPQLTARCTVLLLDQQPRGAEWVAADVTARQFPFDTVEQVRARVARLRAGGYDLVREAGGVVVLRRGGP